MHRLRLLPPTRPRVLVVLFFAFASSAGAFAPNSVLVPLKRWWMPAFGPEGDHMTVDEASPEHPSGTDQGLTWYIAASAGDGLSPIYRLFHDTAMDHMVSRTPGEGGYLTEGQYGWTWDAAQPGLAQTRRAHRPSDGDHVLTFNGENPPGYVLEGSVGWAFPRYGEDLQFGSGHRASLVSISDGSITLKVDRVWGGAAYELWWDGVQFLNHWDAGRELQTALFKPGLGDVQFGPTEAGDRWGHGTPLVELTATARSIYTHTLPLQWGPESYGGGEHRPVLWGGEFDRRATIGHHPRFQVIRWEVGYRPTETTVYTREWLTAYVQPEVSDRVFVYTPSGGFVEQSMPACTESFGTTITQGAIVFASADLRHAIGLYTPETLLANWWDFSCVGGESSTRKINLWDANVEMTAGRWYRKTGFVAVGDISPYVD